MAQEAEKVCQFQDAPAAFEWAETILARYPLVSQIAKLARRPGHGDFTVDDLCDFALSIIAVVERCEPIEARLTFKFVYGRDDSVVVQDLMDKLVRYTYANAEDAKGKPALRLTKLLYGILDGYSHHIHKNRRISMTALARHAEVARRASFYEEGWFDITNKVRTALNTWHDLGNDWTVEKLRERGFIA